MTQTNERLDPLQTYRNLKLARQEILELRASNRKLQGELDEVLKTPSLLGRITPYCLVALLLSFTFCATSVAIARGIDAIDNSVSRLD